TDASRAQALELHIQKRVAEELQRIHADSAQHLAKVKDQLAEESSLLEKPKPATAEPSNALPELTLESPRIPAVGPGNFRELQEQGADATRGAPPPSAPSARGGPAASNQSSYTSLSSQSLSEQITDLKSRLAARPAARELDPAVQQSRRELVACLTKNETRPLLCADEVDNFKKQVHRLQQNWVNNAIA
ncbi:hypothetical protein KEM52_002444, partial [Ascosphaera acerosa]